MRSEPKSLTDGEDTAEVDPEACQRQLRVANDWHANVDGRPEPRAQRRRRSREKNPPSEVAAQEQRS